MTNHPGAGLIRLEPLGPEDPRYLGPFRLVGRLGSGGMGVVHAALDDADGCAAVKSVHRVFASDPEFRDRFAREVALVRRVSAPCVPRFLGADAGADLPWLATEYVPGRTLDAHVREHGPLAGSVLSAFALGVADALAAIHARGVVHRDLKPGNVILSPSGPKVLDFGIARAVEEAAITRTGGLVGTPGWISPEQYRGRPATGRSDVFAWAALVVLAATGRHPHGSGDSDTMALRILSDPPSLEGVPQELREVLARALAKDPAERPDSAGAVAAMAALIGRDEPTVVLSGGGVDLTRVLDQSWTGVEDPGHRPEEWRREEWKRQAPPRKRWTSGRRGPMILGAVGLSLVLIAGTLWAVNGGDLPWSAGAGGSESGAAAADAPGAEAGDTDAVTEAADENTDIPEEHRDLYENGTVVVEVVPGPEPVLVRSLEPAPGQDGEPLEQLRVTFEEVTADFSVDVSGRVEYLPGFGSLTVRSADFPVGVASAPGQTVPEPSVPDTRGVLAQLTPEDPSAEFDVSFLRAAGSVVYYLPDEVRDGVVIDPAYPGRFCLLREATGQGAFPNAPFFAEHGVADTVSGCPDDVA